MSQPQPRVLSVPERGEILRQVVDAKVTSQRGVYGRVDSTGHIFVRTHGPLVRVWGDTWAEVALGNWLTHPAVIAKDFVFTTLTCGLYMWWWLFQTFKKPPLYLLSIDEYGHEHWSQHEISQGQKILRYVLLAVPVLVTLWFIYGLSTVDEVPSRYR
jgi:hypothetical protein